MADLHSLAALRRFGRSFRCAARGIWLARAGPNVQIQLFAALVVAGLVVAYGISGAHLAVVVLSASAVISAELMNTAVERVCDFVADLHGIGQDRRIRDIKDLAAGAVLVVAMGAAATGVLVFGPELG